MTNDKNKRVNMIYNIAFISITSILAILLILFTFTIYFEGKKQIINNPNYQIYTKENVSRYLNYLLIPFILWILLIIGGVIISKYYPYKSKTRVKPDDIKAYIRLKKRIANLDDAYKDKKVIIAKERKKRKIGFIIVSIISLLFLIFPAIYLFDVDNFSNSDNKKEVIQMALHVFPFIIAIGAISIGYLFYYKKSIKRELVVIKEILKTYKLEKYEPKYDKQKEKRIINITRICVLCVSILFIILGSLNGGAMDVLNKAIQICSECVGLA